MNNESVLRREYKIEDIPWMFHALTIQRNTALMYGEKGRRTQSRVEEEVRALKNEYPALCDYSVQEYVWFDCVQAVRNCKTYTVTQEAHYRTDWNDPERKQYLLTEYSNREPIVVTVDDVKFIVTERRIYDEAFIKQIREYLDQVAPIEI